MDTIAIFISFAFCLAALVLFAMAADKHIRTVKLHDRMADIFAAHLRDMAHGERVEIIRSASNPRRWN